MLFTNHATLPHFSRGPRAPTFLKLGLKSTQKSRLALPANPALRINWGKFRSAQDRELPKYWQLKQLYIW
jgi:hypothetical protein